MSESAFGPVRKWGSNTPTPLSDADYELLDAAQVRLDQDRRYQAIRADLVELNRASWEAHLAHPMVGAGLTDPTTIPGVHTEPIPARNRFFRGLFIAAGVTLVVALALVGAVTVGLRVFS